MNRIRMLKALCVGLSCIGLILPTSVLEAATLPAAATTPRAAPQPAKLASDVELDAVGSMHGLVVDVEGVPAAGRTVVLHQMDRKLASTHTDALGRFRIGQLRGGTYRLSVGGHGRIIRAWSANTAPPAGEKVALIVVGGDVVRGQMPLECFFASDAVIIVGLVAAMIAIPIAVHNSGSSSP